MRNEICLSRQVKSLCGEIFALQMRNVRTANVANFISNEATRDISKCSKEHYFTFCNRKTFHLCISPAENLRLITLIELIDRFSAHLGCLALQDAAQCYELPCYARAVYSSRGKKTVAHRGGVLLFFGAPAENRTPDTLIKSQVLYQLSYRGILLSFCFAKMRRICYAGTTIF